MASDMMEIDPAEDEDYNSASDEDFNPDEIAKDGEVMDSSESDSEPGPGQPKAKSRNKKDQRDEEAEDVGFENSGDEATIKQGIKRKRKRDKDAKAGKIIESEDSGGEGGFVRTRAMRAQAHEEAKTRLPLMGIKGATVDVDEIWARLNRKEAPEQQIEVVEEATELIEQSLPQRKPDDLVRIQHSYRFAGKTITEEKLVLRDSAQAKLYFLQHPDIDPGSVTVSAADQENLSVEEPIKAVQKFSPSGQPLLRPLRRISRYEPNPLGTVKNLPAAYIARYPVKFTAASAERLAQLAAEAEARNAKGPKATRLNVVDKSKMDWAEHVDQSGDQQDLDAAKKDKRDYLSRQAFLNQIEMRKEDDRLKGIRG